MTDAITSPLPSLIEFPRDDFAHPLLPWELWWITGDLQWQKRNLCFHLLIARVSNDSVRVTATIADPDSNLEITERSVFDIADCDLSEQQLNLKTSLASFRGSFEFGYHVSANFPDESRFDLSLTPTLPILVSAGAGQFILGEVLTSQYSLGKLHASGSLTLDGVTAPVSGQAWYDRQWSNRGRFEETGGNFNWFGMWLENGVMISLWDTSMRPENGHCWATIAYPDGTHIVAAAYPNPDENGDSFRTEAGRVLPQTWTYELPSVDMKLVIDQRRIQDGARLYIGKLDATCTTREGPVKGYGYCDLIGLID